MTALRDTMSDRRATAIILLIWLVAAGVMIWLAWNYITSLNFRDPDDALRLVEDRKSVV